ncbi:RICIN domain-containing protein [Fodinicola acaciae]|uniref:RICIN domain-containing protein n=1 Tax=Fodinicola acaciae TaxID=2681555 RepID=UPI0013D71F79|nr:ricin-type beta-trefoil lectin domain protein [Fodinicola acaciae]
MNGLKGNRRLAAAGATLMLAAAMLVTAAPAGATTVAGAQPAATTATSIFYVKNANSGRCLTSDQLTAYYNSVYTANCVNAGSQRWRIVGGQFQTQGGTGYCLDTDNVEIFTWACFGPDYYPGSVPYQRWLVDSTEKKWVKNQAMQFCMHSFGGAGEYVVPRTCGNTASRWIFVAA